MSRYISADMAFLSLQSELFHLAYDARSEGEKVYPSELYKEIGHKIKEWTDKIPTADVVEVVRCNQCKYYEGVHDVAGHAPCSHWKCGGVLWKDFCSYGERGKVKRMGDLISRKVRENARGEWIPVAIDPLRDCTYKCSECGFVRDAYLIEAGNYCPNCGAEMRGASDE